VKRQFFVTGTDTDAGKTTVAAGLLCAARRSGLSTAAVKPVASGCFREGGRLLNSDALALLAQCSLPLTYEQVNPYTFEPAIAPHVAAREAGMALSAASLAHAVHAVTAFGADVLVVEGAGGWRVPLNDDEMYSAVPVAMGLPVILVVGIRLGCINHAVLTAEAIRQDGLKMAGWVANIIDPSMTRLEENIQTLDSLLSTPCLGRVPYLENPNAEAVADHLDLTLLT
jgi:dethiobiotin synthetase